MGRGVSRALADQLHQGVPEEMVRPLQWTPLRFYTHSLPALGPIVVCVLAMLLQGPGRDHVPSSPLWWSFVLEEGISDEEAVRLIQMEPPQKKTSAPVITDEGTTQTLVLSGPSDDQLGDENDPFTSTDTEGGS
ncbi:hypothetical protein GBAR_LOCUS27953 [Geodia barretti]|uniref:Uncharacterized protein n=1 Tax=Geodia barretti TaxID=519541 RepID=A0AA35TMJ8_GEOBA|nr:hypothetical protein GBAR_LOCUS27953 [Geodia barretti]